MPPDASLPSPLHHPSSASGRDSSVENTPISTPVFHADHSFAARRGSRDPDRVFTWAVRKPPRGHAPAPAFTDDIDRDRDRDLFFPADDDDDSVFPLFTATAAAAAAAARAATTAASSPTAYDEIGLYDADEDDDALAADMAGSSVSPIDIATARQTSTSPRNQQSNLTSQLQRPSGGDLRQDQGIGDAAATAAAAAAAAATDFAAQSHADGKARRESVSLLSTTPYGARAIPTRDRARRDSGGNAVSGSMMGGMSWGGISMGSFIKDDILMAGTSPYGGGYGFQSPSFHSSSYLPKMEANYMRDYVCCDIKLDSMHELLQHYEEAHAAQPNQTMGRTPRDQQYPNSRAATASSTAQSVQQQAQQTPQQNFAQPQQGFQNVNPQFNNHHTTEQLSSFDNLEDMEMDDGTPAPQPQQAQQQQQQQQQAQPQGAGFQPQPQFGRQQPRAPSVNVNIANAFQGQNLRSATPTTPLAAQPPAFNLQNNPTVSSVNTPTLSTRTTGSQPNVTPPESSMPGTPIAELDSDIAAQLDLSSFDYNQLMQGNLDFNSLSLNNANNNNGGSATIDDPAKRLLNRKGFGNNGFVNPALATSSNGGSVTANTNNNNNNSELSKRVREAQLLNGLAGVGGFVGEEIKPFRCPVIGCEKAYKNQNGLKYHKQHGHQNQQLKENPDGSFSIVDPTTSIPYPGTLGMEKEKPYRCEYCGKRYKNLNGLKYHRQHSPSCNPDFKLNAANVQAMQSDSMQGLNVNVAGAGMV